MRCDTNANGKNEEAFMSGRLIDMFTKHETDQTYRETETEMIDAAIFSSVL